MNRWTEARVQMIVNLSRRRDRILEAPEMDLEALAILAANYDAANMQALQSTCQEDLSDKVNFIGG